MSRRVVVYAVVLVGLRVTVAAPEGCSEPPVPTLEATAARAAAWLADSQQPSGQFLYTYHRDDGDLGGYNEVRHAGVMLSLYQAGEQRAADRGLRWALDRLEDVEGGTAFAGTSRATLGASALLTAALAERRVQTRDGRYDALLRELGGFLVAMQRDDGGFHVAVDVPTGEIDTVATSRYYPGEALWAIARLETAFPDEPWDRAAERGAHFIATERDEVEDVIAPPLNDHWAAYGFAEMAGWSPLSDEVVDYARLLYGRFALLIRTESARDESTVAGWTHGPTRRAAAVGTWVEGQAALARLAAEDRRVADLDRRILRSVRCGTGVLVDRQASDGAWYVSAETRMDDQQHAISGLLAAAELVR